MVKLSLAALVTCATLISTAIATTAAGFVASDSSISFALNIPQDSSNDLYFSLSGHSDASWIAVGMGSTNMANTLIFMAYSDSTGKNITLSPRLVYGNVEPAFTNLSVTVLPGSGIANGVMKVNAMCTGCRSWNGGSIDPKNTAAQFIFAVGPNGNIKSNSGSANTKRHSEYGSFTMDLTKAVGVKGVPALTADTAGTKQDSLTTDTDFALPLHAALMIVVFVGIMPLGIIILRNFGSPKWHGLNQTLSAALALVGAGLGIYISLMYNRSKNFSSGHQIFGLVIMAAMIAQWVLGYLHHKIYVHTNSPTKLAPFHVWLGRVVIVCGIADGFLGFPLAINPKYNWILLALVLVVVVLAPFAFWHWKRKNSKATWSGDSDRSPAQFTPVDASDINMERVDGTGTEDRQFV